MFPKRWDNAKTGRADYAPAFANEWAPRICDKPKVKCGDCLNRAFLPMTDDVIEGHTAPAPYPGVYPMPADETCWFLATDFDKTAWRDDAAAFLQACVARGVPVALERSLYTINADVIEIAERMGVERSVGAVLGDGLQRHLLNHR